MSEEEVIMKYKSIDNDNMKEIYEETIDGLKKEITKMREYYDGQHRQNLIQYEETIKKEKQVLNDNNESLKIQINQLKNEVMTCENESREKFRKEYDIKYQENISQIRNLHKVEVESLQNVIKINNERVNPLLDKLTEKKDFDNSTEQGNYGESFLDEIVDEKGLAFDTKAHIVDSSKEGGSGDRIIRFDNGFVLMVEVKNENVIKKGDREQFINHSSNDFIEKKCDYSLFLSLRTQQIPKVGKAIIPIYKGNMVYYGLDEEESLQAKKLKITKCIEEIYEVFKKEKKKDIPDEDSSIEVYNLYLETLNNQKIEYEGIIKTNKKIVEEYEKKVIDVNTNLNKIHREIQNNNIKVNPNLIDDKIYVKNLILKIKEWKDKENIVFKNSFRKKIKEEMDLSELDKNMIEKIKLTDIQ